MYEMGLSDIKWRNPYTNAKLAVIHITTNVSAFTVQIKMDCCDKVCHDFCGFSNRQFRHYEQLQWSPSNT